ncbi:uncharacterized protein YpmB [Caldalkalibacillus uzonensis]|uniref:Uncharacterized protein YpmB n=1 Tax=Caldalkalibacillus uzonensis TaxID=353224 RepID=A0ABU0CN84_9BACI|nr:hypothetical protein [Caldalkalibacillus uzonensis]MDQ0337617.1 uncharacterized protein YpmB [Caldalkalibacillus uzonensis]
MKKWLIASSLCIGLIIWLMVNIGLSLKQDQHAGFVEARAVAEQETGGEVLEQFRFHGEQTYFIFTIEDDSEQKFYVVVDEQGQLKSFPAAEARLTQEDVAQMVSAEYADWTVKAVRPAYVNQQLCWEVLAVDDQGRMIYAYYTMADGQFIKSYTLEH